MGEGEIGQLRLFLDYGPIGIAGLSLILAIIGLMSANLDEYRYKLLRLVLYFGAFSLVALLIAEFMKVDAEHELRVRVVPHDNDGARNALPEAFVQVNLDEIDRSQPYAVIDDVIVSVDVTRAIEAIEQAQTSAAIAQASAEESQADVEQAQADVARSSEALNAIIQRLDEVESVLNEAQSEAGIETLRLANSLSGSIDDITRAIETEAMIELKQAE